MTVAAASGVLASGCGWVWAPAASAHAARRTNYRARITAIEPSSMPVRAAIVDGDQIRVTNGGTGVLEVCRYGAPGSCRPWVRVEGGDVTYHDHRLHWMVPDRVPPMVDVGDPHPQLVQDVAVAVRYDGVPGVVHARLEYVGGQPWWRRHGEQLFITGAIMMLFAAYAVDSVRRHRRGRRVECSG